MTELVPAATHAVRSGAPPGAWAAMSVDVEDWFQSENVKSQCPRSGWERLDLRVERNTMRMLEILDDCGASATFFVLGWVAERCPQLVRAIASAGHELASHGYGHELVYGLGPAAFREDVVRAKGLIEDIAGVRVRGYRAPCFSITDWAIPILQETGHDYDSSSVPAIAHDRYGRLAGMDPGTTVAEIRDGFFEIALPCLRVGSRGVPWGGGGYFRLAPFRVWLRGIDRIRRRGDPYVFYIHPWEIDPGQPVPGGMNPVNRFRQRVNLGRCDQRFAALAAALPWTTMGVLLDQWVAGRGVGPAAGRTSPASNGSAALQAGGFG